MDRQEALSLKTAWKTQGVRVYCSTATGGCGAELVAAVAEWRAGVRQMIPHLRHKSNTADAQACVSNAERQETAEHHLILLALAKHFRSIGYTPTLEATHSNRRRSDLLLTGGALRERVVAVELQLTPQSVSQETYRATRHYRGTNQKVEAVQWVRGWASDGHLQAVLDSNGAVTIRNGPLPTQGRLPDVDEARVTGEIYLLDYQQGWASAPLESVHINPWFTVDEYGVTRDLFVSRHLWNQYLYYQLSRRLAAAKKVAGIYQKYLLAVKAREAREARRRGLERLQAVKQRSRQQALEMKSASEAPTPVVAYAGPRVSRTFTQGSMERSNGSSSVPVGVAAGQFRRDRAQARARGEGAHLERLAKTGQYSLPRLLCTTSPNQGQWLTDLLIREYAGMSEQAHRLGLTLSDQELEHGHLFSLHSSGTHISSFAAHTKELPIGVVMGQEMSQTHHHLIYTPATAQLQAQATTTRQVRFIQAFEALERSIFTGLPVWVSDPELTPAQQFITALATGRRKAGPAPISFYTENLRSRLLTTLLAFEQANPSFVLDSINRKYEGWAARVIRKGEPSVWHFTYLRQEDRYYQRLASEYDVPTYFWAVLSPSSGLEVGSVRRMAPAPQRPGFLVLEGVTC